MTSLLISLAALIFFIPAFAQADDLATLGNSCRAKSIERFYCPVSGSGWWYGPYFDNGCRVQCNEGAKAVCVEASCSDDQSGESVPSSCSCN